VTIIITIVAVCATLSAVQTVEDDNGAVYRILHVTHPWRDGPAQAQVATPDNDVVNLLFDCHGHMAPFDSGMRSIAPRSVAGRIAEIACAEAKEK
jgi:hypothetical protein